MFEDVLDINEDKDVDHTVDTRCPKCGSIAVIVNVVGVYFFCGYCGNKWLP